MGQPVRFLHFIRILNCLIAAGGIVVGAWLTDGEFAYYEIIITALATFCLCASGNLMNDVLDIQIDRISHPDRALVRGFFSVRFAVLWTVLFAIVSLGLAATVNWVVFSLAALAGALLVLYNLYAKNLPLVGNIIIALLAGLTIITGGAAVNPWLEFSLPNPLLPAWFAFLIHLLRELVKDIEDMEGDKLVHARTLPLVIGGAQSLKIVNVFLLLLVLSTLLPVLVGWYKIDPYLALVLFLVDLPLVILVVSCLRNPSKTRLRRLSNGLKLAMVAGMIALVLA